MLVFEDFNRSIKIRKYGEMARVLKTSSLLFTGRRAEDGINIIDIMVKSCNDFSRYQGLIKYAVILNSKIDFLDLSLVMGKFFGVYNLYNYEHLSIDVRNRLVSDESINSIATRVIISYNFSDIYQYVSDNFPIGKEEFFNFISSLFVVRDDNSLYNSPVFSCLAHILMGNALFLKGNQLSNGFIGSSEAILYFSQINDKSNARVI